MSRPKTALPSRTQPHEAGKKPKTPKTALQAEPEAVSPVIPPIAGVTNPEPEAEEEYGIGDEPVDYSDYSPLSDPEPENDKDGAQASDHELDESDNHDEDEDLDDAEYLESEEGELSVDFSTDISETRNVRREPSITL